PLPAPPFREGVQRHRHRPGHRAEDRRAPWRPHLGRRGARPRRDDLFHHRLDAGDLAVSGQKSLRLLLVEDSARDAAHVALTLRRAGWVPDVRRVETREEMLSALGEGEWDAIVSDHQLPRFSASDALETLKATRRDIPS